MTSNPTISDLLQKLLENPSAFDEIVSQFDNEGKCYWALRDNAKESLDEFDRYLRFYEVFVQESNSDIVYKDLEQNINRSLKNMVLGDSSAGERFPIRTATEFQRRINAFQDLGVAELTHRSATFTLLEHIYDKDEHEAHDYEILNGLLDNIPNSPTDAIEILTRARFVSATESIDKDTEAFDQAVDSYLSDLPDPLPDDTRTGPELMEIADEKSYAEPEKVDLVRAGLVRQPDLNALQDYLYLSARDVVERYRHSSRQDPWRGELQLALRQWNCIQNLFSERMSLERQVRSESYRSLVHGELRSGGRWRSQRDINELPNPNFMSASKHYMKAAVEISSIDTNRYIKYLSKSFRNQATAAHHRELGPGRGWETSHQIHEKAVKLMPRLVENNEIEEDSKLNKTIVGTIALHRFRSHKAAAVSAFVRGNPESAIGEADQAWELIDAVPTYEKTDLLQAVQAAAEARRHEEVGEFQQAIERYRNADHSQMKLEKRAVLAEIKQHLIEGDYDSAIDGSQKTFGESSPVTTAVQIVAGESATAPRISPPLLEELNGVTHKKKMSFGNFVFLAQTYTENKTSDEITREIESLLMEM